jgi:hypothetical protein
MPQATPKMMPLPSVYDSIEAIREQALANQRGPAQELTSAQIFDIADSDECKRDDLGQWSKFSKLAFARAVIAADQELRAVSPESQQ